MKNVFLPAWALLALLLGLCSCQSPTPTAGDMDLYYKEAEARIARQIAHYGELRDEGRLSQEDYDEKVEKARSSLGKTAMEIAWTRHEMVEARMRDLSIPTAGHEVQISAPGIGNAPDTFYHAAGSEGGGYQGMGPGMWHGYQPGSTVDAINGALGTGGGGPGGL
jgi:hypothetical protein